MLAQLVNVREPFVHLGTVDARSNIEARTHLVLYECIKNLAKGMEFIRRQPLELH
jgi:hypothetical protein